MARAARTCSRCPAIITTGTRCDACITGARRTPTARAADRARRPDGNPYSTRGHQAFRRAVLARDPICVICRSAWATVADHYPLSRRELIEQHLDPNDPTHGRGLCKRDHDRQTALHQPGGWNVRKGGG